jgi:hypothetical protein
MDIKDRHKNTDLHRWSSERALPIFNLFNPDDAPVRRCQNCVSGGIGLSRGISKESGHEEAEQGRDDDQEGIPQ